MNRTDDLYKALIQILTEFNQRFMHLALSETDHTVVDDYEKCLVVLDAYIEEAGSRYHMEQRALLPELTKKSMTSLKI